MTSKQAFDPKYRPIWIAALGIIIAVLINWLTNLYSPDGLKDYFGDDYKMILLLFTVLLVLLMLILTHKQEKDGSDSRRSLATDKYNIPYTKVHRAALEKARKAISNGRLDEALGVLSDLRLPLLNEAVSLLSARLAKYQQGDIQGVLSFEQKDTSFNRITKDVLALVGRLESEMKILAGFDVTIRKYLMERVHCANEFSLSFIIFEIAE